MQLSFDQRQLCKTLIKDHVCIMGLIPVGCSLLELVYSLNAFSSTRSAGHP